MNIHRRTVIKAGLGLGASVLLSSRESFAQTAPLIQKKIPSSGESIPIIGIGTARRYEEITNDAGESTAKGNDSAIPNSGWEGDRQLAVLRYRGSGGR